jgi:hypothetical protein
MSIQGIVGSPFTASGTTFVSTEIVLLFWTGCRPHSSRANAAVRANGRFDSCAAAKYLHSYSTSQAACARSDKVELTGWAYFVEKLFLDCGLNY